MSDETTEYMSLPVKTAQFVSDEVLRLRRENTALKAAVERVRALHDTFPPNRHRWCRDCVQEFPCPTLRALEVGSE